MEAAIYITCAMFVAGLLVWIIDANIWSYKTVRDGSWHYDYSRRMMRRSAGKKWEYREATDAERGEAGG